MRKTIKFALLLLVISIVFQAGFVTYAIVNQSISGQTALNQGRQDVIDPMEIVISGKALNQIKSSNPDQYERNVTHYKNILLTLNVHERFNYEIERLIMEGYPLPDILIGYEFLHQNFGKISELEIIVSQKSMGIAWDKVFTTYHAAHQAFIPSTFDPDYLEELMNTPSLTADDIMIADQISFATGKAFEDIVDAKIGTEHWKSITVIEGILFSNDSLPRVPVTIDQLNIFMEQGGLTEEQVVEAIVLAHKLGQDTKVVVDKFIAGASIEVILAESYIEKYQSDL